MVEGSETVGNALTSSADAEAGDCHPVCRWKCDSPVCPQVCDPVCEAPKCSHRCSPLGPAQCAIKCAKPKCEIRCGVDACENDKCPPCKVACAEPVCRSECLQPTVSGDAMEGGGERLWCLRFSFSTHLFPSCDLILL